MTLRLSYFVPPTPLIAAKERGLLDGLEIVEQRTTSSSAQLHDLLAGELDAVVTAIDNLFEWTTAGADLRLVAQVEEATPLAIHAAATVRSLGDLDGCAFAVDAYANGFALLARSILLAAGVEVEWIEVGGVRERYDALLAGDVVATLLGPPFGELAQAAGFRSLTRTREVFPDYPGQGLVVRADLIGTSRLDGFLAAMRLSGLLPIDPRGLDVVSRIRTDLGAMPANVSLHALCETP